MEISEANFPFSYALRRSHINSEEATEPENKPYNYSDVIMELANFAVSESISKQQFRLASFEFF